MITNENEKRYSIMSRYSAMLLGFLFLATLISLQPLMANAQSSQVLEKEIEGAIFSEDWAKVIELLKSVDTQTPDPVLRMIKGHACLALNRNNESLCLFLSVSSENDLNKWEEWTKIFSANNSDKAIAYYFKGDALARQKKWNEALEIFNEGVGINSKHVLLLNARGIVHAAKEKFSNAIVDFDEAIKQSKEQLADTYANIGCLRIQKKDGAKGALNAFNEALKISPDFALALHGRGCVKLVLNKLQEAEEDFKNAEKNGICANKIIAGNMINITAYLGGKTKEELYTMLSTPGTTFDASFKEVGKLWDNYKNNQTQFNYNKFAENFGGLGTTNQKQFFNSYVKNDLKSNDIFRSTFGNNLNTYYDWNVRGKADSWSKTIQGSLTGIGVLSTEPLTKAGAMTGALAMENVHAWTKHNADSAKIQVDLFKNNFGKQSIGGVEAKITFDDGKWPFDPSYGLQYQVK